MTIAQTALAHESTSPATARAERALALYAERGHLIRAVGADTYSVPSSGMLGKRYRVRYGGAVESCTCPAFEFGGGKPCKHLLCVGIAHAARRSGVREVRIPAAVAGDPFKHAAKRKGCPSCYGGVVYIGIEEDGIEHLEPVPCRRCSRSR